MSDEMKDFRYYADKAEAWLETTWKESPGNDIGHSIDKATVYAELAKAAPKVEPKPKSQFFYFANGERLEGQRCFGKRFNNPLVDPARNQCTRLLGHDGEHETENGERFDGDEANRDWPMRDND